jgi:hypothetical protein
MGELAEKMALVRAEKMACWEFAAHISNCANCLAKWRTSGYSGLCENGLYLRDKHLTIAKARAAIDPDFAKEYTSLFKGKT